MTKGKRKRQQIFKSAGVTPSPFGGKGKVKGGGVSIDSSLDGYFAHGCDYCRPSIHFQYPTPVTMHSPIRPIRAYATNSRQHNLH